MHILDYILILHENDPATGFAIYLTNYCISLCVNFYYCSELAVEQQIDKIIKMRAFRL